MWLSVNGKRVQDGHTKTMIFTVAQIVAYLSQFITLEPGDIITTGTPPGVGLGQKPAPWYLTAGDVVEPGIDKLGQQRQDFVPWQGSAGVSPAARRSSPAAPRGRSHGRPAGEE